jgi:hypothetical protein
MRQTLDFAAINSAALSALPMLCARWMPDGKRVGREYVAKNPTRADKRAGSFKVNLQTGRWADFATGDKGGDAVSLAAYLFKLRQSEAARRLAGALGIPEGARRGWTEKPQFRVSIPGAGLDSNMPVVKFGVRAVPLDPIVL